MINFNNAPMISAKLPQEGIDNWKDLLPSTINFEGVQYPQSCRLFDGDVEEKFRVWVHTHNAEFPTYSFITSVLAKDFVSSGGSIDSNGDSHGGLKTVYLITVDKEEMAAFLTEGKSKADADYISNALLSKFLSKGIIESYLARCTDNMPEYRGYNPDEDPENCE
jgi:hypothetical protein